MAKILNSPWPNDETNGWRTRYLLHFPDLGVRTQYSPAAQRTASRWTKKVDAGLWTVKWIDSPNSGRTSERM